MTTDVLIDAVRQWGKDKGITGLNGKATLLSQLSKTQEELNETRVAAEVLNHMEGLVSPEAVGLREQAELELIDGIGDCTVTLILAAELAGVKFEECLLAAYEEIKGRTGSMQNGMFVKDK